MTTILVTLSIAAVVFGLAFAAIGMSSLLGRRKMECSCKSAKRVLSAIDRGTSTPETCCSQEASCCGAEAGDKRFLEVAPAERSGGAAT